MDGTAYLQLVLSTAQAGLTYSRDPFDIERFRALQQATAHLLARGEGPIADELAQLISSEYGYPTPKLDVRGFVRDRGGAVLLVRERADGLWTLPGGWCDVGESPAESVAREIREETGLECEVLRLLALFDKKKHPHPPQLPHAYKAFFLCDPVGGELLQGTAETTEARYFHLDRLPPLSAHRVVESQLVALAAHVDEDRLDALFD